MDWIIIGAAFYFLIAMLLAFILGPEARREESSLGEVVIAAAFWPIFISAGLGVLAHDWRTRCPSTPPID